MYRRVLYLFVLLGACALTGCSLLWTDADKRDVDETRANWESLGWDDYTFRFRWNCFCGSPYISLVELVVRDGELVSGTLVDSNRALTDEELADWRTVDGLFDLIEEAREEDAHVIRDTYHAEYGYPIDVWIDYQANVADEERGFVITSLHPDEDE